MAQRVIPMFSQRGQPLARELRGSVRASERFGFGRTLFRYENGSEQVMRDTIAGLARGLGERLNQPLAKTLRACA
jgi:hypothetical protein